MELWVTATRQEIRQRLLKYYSEAEAEHWMLSPHLQLDGETANNALLQGRSPEVIAILDRLDADGYI